MREIVTRPSVVQHILRLVRLIEGWLEVDQYSIPIRPIYTGVTNGTNRAPSAMLFGLSRIDRQMRYFNRNPEVDANFTDRVPQVSEFVLGVAPRIDHNDIMAPPQHHLIEP